MKFLPEFGYELRSTIRHYSLRNPMQTKNASNVQLRIGDDMIFICSLHLDGYRLIFCCGCLSDCKIDEDEGVVEVERVSLLEGDNQIALCSPHTT